MISICLCDEVEMWYDDPVENYCTAMDLIENETMFDKISRLSFKDWDTEALMWGKKYMVWHKWVCGLSDGQVNELLKQCFDFMEIMHNWSVTLNQIKTKNHKLNHDKWKAATKCDRLIKTKRVIHAHVEIESFFMNKH